jgi:hypothetical protein
MINDHGYKQYVRMVCEGVRKGLCFYVRMMCGEGVRKGICLYDSIENDVEGCEVMIMILKSM